MTTYAGLAPRHVNTYHNNNSLIFRFILAEFAESYAEMQRLDALCSRTQVALPAGQPPSRDVDGRMVEIEACLIRLVGSTRDYMRLFSWNFCEGILAKLKTYTALFL